LAVTATWVERTDITGGPSPRQDHTWTVGRDNKMAYLFGGLTADGPSNELWELNLLTDTWTLLQPSGDAPPPRFGHTATWVAHDGHLIVWSGQGSSAFFDDVWAYDPYVNTWSQLPSSGAIPAARYGSCAALGPDGELWISHGFTEDGGRFADTRSYNLETGIWTDHTPAGDHRRIPLDGLCSGRPEQWQQHADEVLPHSAQEPGDRRQLQQLDSGWSS
jgi:hypothetical protein